MLWCICFVSSIAVWHFGFVFVSSLSVWLTWSDSFIAMLERLWTKLWFVLYSSRQQPWRSAEWFQRARHPCHHMEGALRNSAFRETRSDSVITYSPSCFSKPAWFFFSFHWTHNNMWVGAEHGLEHRSWVCQTLKLTKKSYINIAYKVHVKVQFWEVNKKIIIISW